MKHTLTALTLFLAFQLTVPLGTFAQTAGFDASITEHHAEYKAHFLSETR